MISSNLSAGTLSIELSGFGEKIFTNCGASENFGKNPEYLRGLDIFEYKNLSNKKFNVHVLQGTTGSGKTIVYFEALKKILKKY